MAFRNKRVAACSICRETVALGTGWTEGPPWKTTCDKCSGPKKASKVQVALAGPQVAFSLTGARLDMIRFEAYRAATSGARYDAALKANVAAPDRALRMVTALQEGGFTLDIAPEVAATLQVLAGNLKQGIVAAEGRADALDLLLQSRGQALYAFQKTGVAWLASRTGALLMDDMGLGKTIQTLAALPEGAAVLVVGPAVAKGVWRREAAKWRPEFKVTVLEGRGSFRFPEKNEILITNYDILPKHMVPTVNGDTCGKRPCISPRETRFQELSPPCNACMTWGSFKDLCPEGMVLVADEAHKLKNPKTSTTIRFRALSKAALAQQGRVWLLSATPLMNRPSELWSVLQAADLAYESFGSWDNFVACLGGTYTGYMGAIEWGTPKPECASRLAKVSLRRQRTEVLPDLPGKRYQEHIVAIDKATRKICDKASGFFNDYTRFSRILEEPKPESDISEEIQEAVNELKNSDGLSFEALSRARTALATAKIPALIEMIEEFEEQDEPVVVFSAHRKPIDILAKRPGWAVITGDTPPAERTRIEDAFQRGELKGIGGTIQAAGVAITLTRAAHAIFVDREWSPVLNQQAEDRLSRIGQLRGVLIHLLIAEHPLDDRMFQILAIKTNIITHSVEASRRQGDYVLPTVETSDLDALTKAAEVERLAEEKAQEEAEARRNNALEKFGGPQTEEERTADEKKRRRQVREDHWASEAKKIPAPRHIASTPRQVWAAEALSTLAQLDPDRAAVKNDVGFSASDGSLGHKLAYLAGTLGLSDQAWGLALALCTKYHRQVGKAPNE